MTDDGDEALVQAVADGDAGAFARLVDRHAATCLRLAEPLLADRAAAEDCVQEAFIKLWTRPDRFDPRRGGFRRWFTRLVLNQAIDMARRQRKASVPEANVGADDDTAAVDDTPGPEAAMARAQQRQALARAIATLPRRQQSALVLTYYEGLTNRDVGAILSCNVKAVESLLVRARRTLATRLPPALREPWESL